jgi:hypothetical protein
MVDEPTQGKIVYCLTRVIASSSGLIGVLSGRLALAQSSR